MSPPPRLIFLSLLAPLLLVACSPEEGAPRRSFINIGTGGVTGVYYPTGGAVCRMVNRLRPKHGIRCNVEATGGSVYNVNSIWIGEQDFGIVQSDVGYKAWHGIAPFKGKMTVLQSLFSIHSETVTLVARADANIHTLDDIRGKRINIGSPGSGQERTARALLESCGIQMTDLGRAEGLKAAEMPDALRDNKLDAYFYVVGHPTANIKDVSTGTQVRIVPLTGPCVDALVDKWPYFVHTFTPGGLYEGNDADIPTFGVKATLLANGGIADDVAYEVVKSVFENIDTFRKLHPAFARLEERHMLEGLTAPIHPGAMRYYVEKGWIGADH